MRFDQPQSLALLGTRRRAALLVVELVVGPRREVLDRLAERQVVDLLDEADDVAALATAEAVPKTAGRRHVERGRALVVEGAEALHRAATRALERDVLADHIDDW